MPVVGIGRRLLMTAAIWATVAGSVIVNPSPGFGLPMPELPRPNSGVTVTTRASAGIDPGTARTTRPDNHPGRDAGQGGAKVHETASAGPGCRADTDVGHGSQTAPPAPGFRRSSRPSVSSCEMTRTFVLHSSSPTRH